MKKTTQTNEYIEAIASFGSVSTGMIPMINRSMQQLGSNTIRSTFNRSDYNYYRPGEGIPQTIESSIEMCNKAYNNIPIVKSVVDMMGDFTVEGIRIEHRNKNIQNFLNDWAKHVDFYRVSERIANTLYRISNCPVQITYGSIPMYKEKEWKQSSADIQIVKENITRKRIPLKYTVLHPLTVEVIGERLPYVVGERAYGLRIYNNLEADKKQISDIKKLLPNMLFDIPDAKAVNIDGRIIIPMKPENLKMLFYKKDDWLTRAWPMIHSILGPLFMLEKMHLADNKALDGAISQIRLWTLGDFEHKVYPTATLINKLRSILANIGTGDTMDLVWGPELKFQESDPQGHRFLKKEKYEQVMTEIYAGLGVPSSLTGAGSYEGFSNNSISMKAMVERLEYGRKILQDFWESQLIILQKALNWKYPAQISFDSQVMSDEGVERKLLLDLWDRDIISTQRIRELCKHDPILESLRINKEHKRISTGKVPAKASPYHSPNTDNEIRKIIMQGGGVTPSEIGFNLKERKPGERPLVEMKGEAKSKKAKGKAGQGRPLGQKDSKKRTRNEKPRQTIASVFCPECNSDDISWDRTNGPSITTCSNCGHEFDSTANQLTFVELFNWANSIQEEINELLTPFFLQYSGKKNLRSLTKAESIEFENLKFSVLSNMKPYEDINTTNIVDKLNGSIASELKLFVETLHKIFLKKHEREPTITEVRQMQSSAFAIKYEPN